ncbi:MAG: hypothetical protein ABSG38_16765 [Spirochaetia bacterium]|jgi:hypothetical protein
MRFKCIAALAALAVFGCASAQDSFLLSNLDAQAKARALVDQGVIQYQSQLIRKGDLSKVASVREYFTMALRYDPQNLLAARYRDLVDNFRSAQVSQALKEAQSYFARQRRSEEENYAMCAAVQTASRLDPSNASAARLARDTETTRQTLIAQYLSKAWTSLAKAAQAAQITDRENADIDAYQSFGKVILLDPQNSTATGQTKSLKTALDQIAASQLAGVNKLVVAGQFENARDQIAQIAAASRKVGGILDARVAAARYSLDYRWARSLYSHKAYVLAEDKVDEALRLSETDEALALKKKIADLAAQEEQQTSFDASIQQIDSLIDGGDLAAASTRIEALAKRTVDQAGLDQLDTRRQKVRSYLPQMYAAAVNDYRNEDFKGAIDLLRTIVSIDVSYEQAADYLDKATAKQNLVEQF